MDDRVFYLNTDNILVDFKTQSLDVSNFVTDLKLGNHFLSLFRPPNPRQTYVHVPDGFYKPEELGLDLPKCTLLTIGHCSIFARWVKKWTIRGRQSFITNPGWRGFELAHAHDDRICLSDGRYVYRDKGIPDEVIWHEYAHILADCEIHGHDYEWVKQAKNLGLVNPTPYTRHTYYGAPVIEWGSA